MTPEIQALLEPIPGANPAGEWLRYESTYDRILQARREDDETLPQGVWQTAAKRADWAEVEAVCCEALARRSKDLQLGAYLTEAWMHRRGPAGAALGIQLLAELCRRFWDSVYPLLDGDDQSFRLAPFEWLDQKLPVHLRLLPLSAAPREGQRPFNYADWEQALRRGTAQSGDGDEAGATSGRNQGQDAEQDPGHAKVSQALERTPPAALLATVESLESLHAAAQQTAAQIDALTGTSSAVLLHVRQTLERILGFLKPWSERARRTAATLADAASASPGSAPASQRGSGAAAQHEGAAESRASASASASAFGAGAESGIQSRNQAYQRLDEVAEYLLRTEPHSPTGYLLKRAVRWGELPLTQLLVELVPDGQNLADIYRLLGVAGSGNRNKS